MSTTTIEWCIRPGTKPETWNYTTGCNKVSQGCKNCYAEVMHKRLQKMMPSKYSQPFLAGAVAHEDTLQIPYKWKSPRTVFVNSMSDLFHEHISMEALNHVFFVMASLPQHTFIILTKRPKRMLLYLELEFFRNVCNQPLSNVWLGVSVEDQATANERIPYLLQTPAAVRFLSCEPLLSKLDILKCFESREQGKPPFKHVFTKKVDWVIVGGESGHHARPMHPDWVRSLRDQCKAADVPFFFKQWGEWAPRKFGGDGKAEMNWIEQGLPWQYMCKVGKKQSGNTIDGKQYQEFPKPKTNA